MNSRVFIALGSNLGQPLQHANAAIAALKKIPQTVLIQHAPFYRSTPLGPQNQPDFLNTVIEVSTTLSAEQLLNYTQQIEHDLGRERKEQRWGPRTLDLDILLFGNQMINSERLIIPHYDMMNREFVLYPLFDLDPSLRFPDGSLLKDRIKAVDKKGLQHWAQ